ncbi:ergothioneine biosynthesis protein EgtB [Roseofilum casamattae]|uniref:Ergothioneine biosynthesis protein EgtB n=1 Tax=Roseofilum casamattae BLCC-M143 TaxID=3022442 RepID=A0ABT7BZU3_9CYAN|nr:ergothioneine biosynthesis protein EgtB [Roseofilum casamattae]MDJ1184728.1 ergothioneine biosynthesis protein EgtB [Roseofilum casamattae BLCC-M143]
MLITIPDAQPSLSLSAYYQQVRQLSEQICQPLEIEDYVVQSMSDASPLKWHLAHTAWFFETFILVPHCQGYSVFHPKYDYILNSYYESLGERVAAAERGTLSRPTVAEIYRYRAYVDEAMQSFIADNLGNPELESLIILGLHHEQQHQEFLLTNIKHIFGNNPLRPVYKADLPTPNAASVCKPLDWLDYPAQLYEIGHDGEGFAFDNEQPRHRVYLQDYQLASRLVTNGEYLEFIQAGGYNNPDYWLSEGWQTTRSKQWKSPLYWEEIDGDWWLMTLGGMRRLNENEPVCHVSFYEADAYARWAGKRLPTEAEWEVATTNIPVAGNLLESGMLHPAPALGNTQPEQLFGDVWEWTNSTHQPYPGYRLEAGIVGEYNGKLMCNRLVLRGGSCVTALSHIRPTYRNFYPPSARWQFTGIRLAATH